MNIKKNDTVIVLSGKDKGKKGKVQRTLPESGKVLVEGINMATCHVKPRKQGDQGGIIRRESPIYACKVMRVCPKCDKPTRAAYKLTDDGKKVRVCKLCGAEI
ncbi:MAG: 50S ribosomal protein L24 [Pyramidobacter sp.]|nr:50S ribosomal protein L24 [Pyramidobacter sp.]